MKWRTLILLLLVTLLPLSCRRTEDKLVDGDNPGLSIGIEFPFTPVTKAASELPATEAEKTIHSLSLWVFRHDNHTPVGYLPITDFPEDGGVKWYTVPVDWNFVNNRPPVDVFVLANAASINLDGPDGLDGDSSWETVSGSVFGKVNEYDHFGVNEPVTAVGANGLPMSGMGENMKISGSSTRLQVDAVTLQRAVSRFRMVFCRMKTEGEEEEKDQISIQKITIYGGKFPNQELVFTTGATGIKILDEGTYDPTVYERTWPDNTPIRENEVPENFIYINQNPVTYQEDLDAAVTAETLTDLGYTYFRESDQKLMGRIYYTINGNARFREFSMAAPGDFARNHTWTLFGYFLSGRNLQLSLSVQPWDRTNYLVDFSEQAVTVTRKFMVDDTTVQLTETSHDHWDAKLIPGKVAKGTLNITTPIGGKLMIYPEGAASLFSVTPTSVTINPNDHSGLITIEIRNAVTSEVDLDVLSLDDKSITLSFTVEHAGREIDANSEIIDQVYRFCL